MSRAVGCGCLILLGLCSCGSSNETGDGSPGAGGTAGSGATGGEGATAGSGGAGAGSGATGGAAGFGATGGAAGSGATGGAAGSGASSGAAFTTYLGGGQFEQVRDVAVDAAGNIYVTGGTSSPNFPTTTGVVQPAIHPGPPSNPSIDNLDVFVVKLDPSGKLLWSTYLGGPNYDRAYAIGVDSGGSVYVGGRAGAGFPVSTGAFQTQFNGGQSASFYGPQDGFVCKLKPDGKAIIFCSYFGTSDPWIVRDIAVDSAGDVYLASARASGSYPTAVASKFVNSPLGGDDAVIAKVASDGSQVKWASYAGGSAKEFHENSVRLDSKDNPVLAFTTESSNVQTSANAFDKTYAGGGDIFVTRFDPTNGSFVWGAYVGGTGNESLETHELAVDQNGEIFLAAPTTSPDFPVTPGVFQPSYGGGGNDMFIARIASDGTKLIASTFLGGTKNDRPEGCDLGPAGLYFTGTTTSPNFPTTSQAASSNLGGTRDAVAVVISRDLKQLVYSSFVGGSKIDVGRAARVAPAGTFVLGGQTDSGNLSTLNAYQPNYGGGTADGFIAAFVP